MAGLDASVMLLHGIYYCAALNAVTYSLIPIPSRQSPYTGLPRALKFTTPADGSEQYSSVVVPVRREARPLAYVVVNDAQLRQGAAQALFDVARPTVIDKLKARAPGLSDMAACAGHRSRQPQVPSETARPSRPLPPCAISSIEILTDGNCSEKPDAILDVLWKLVHHVVGVVVHELTDSSFSVPVCS